MFSLDRKFILGLALVVFYIEGLVSTAVAAETVRGSRGSSSQSREWVPPRDLNMERLDPRVFQPKLAYSSSDNFMNKDVYGSRGLRSAFVHKDCAALLKKAGEGLAEKNKGRKNKLHFVVYDAVRPCKIQQAMFKITPDPRYVADPGNCEDATKVGQHNLGLAIDIGLADANENELAMGTKFDTFSKKSHIDEETEETLKPKERENRKLLRDLMTEAGLRPLKSEWWHFTCPKKSSTDYKIVP